MKFGGAPDSLSAQDFIVASSLNKSELETNFPASNFQIGDLGKVLTGENEFFSSKVQFWTAPKYENPAGLYIVKNDIDTNPINNYWDFWQEQSVNSLKTVVFDVTTDWLTLFGAKPNFEVNSFINYNGITYINKTGNYTNTSPDQDQTNWGSYIDLSPQVSVAYKEGRYFYDEIQKAHSFYAETNAVPPTREGRVLRSRIMNNEAFELVKGDIVKIVGVSGTMPLAELSQADTISDVRSTIGMIMHNIPSGENGYAAVFDTIIGVDTSTAQVNDLVYLDPFNPGKFTFEEPRAPYYTLPFGFVSVVDSLNGIIGVRFGGYSGTDTTVNIEGSLNGITTKQQTVTFVDDGVNVYADVKNKEFPNEDLPVMFSGKRYLLNTTTGTGVDGAARIQLNLGTAIAPQGNYIYIWLNGGVPELGVSTDFPQIDHAQIAIMSLKDLTGFQAEGVQVYQRTNNSPNGSVSDGLLRALVDKARFIGALYQSGVDPALIIDTGVAPDSVNLTTTAGLVFQFRLQPFDATTGVEYWILNHPTLGVTKITDLNQIDVDAQGNSLTGNGVRFGLTFIGGQNSENEPDKIYINLPDGSYGNDLDCINDVNNFQIASVPSGIALKTNAFRLCRVCLRRNTTSGGEYINILESNGLGNFQNERGFPLGTASGGGGGVSNQTLSSLHGEPAITGLYNGGLAVQNGTTQVDIATGSGQIVNFYNDYQAPVKTPVSWPDQTITIPNLSTDLSTYIYVDNTGIIQTQNTPITPGDDRTKLPLAFTINDTSIGQIKDVIPIPNPIGTISQSFIDYNGFIGATSRGGEVQKTLSPGTNGDLALRVDTHRLFFPGVNWYNSKTNPNELTFTETDPALLDYYLQTGELVSSANGEVDPLNYDNNGVLTLVPSDGAGRRTTIQYLYQLVNGDYVMLYGQNVYDDLTVALEALGDDAKSLIVPDFISSFGTALAAILVSQSCLDLDDPITASIEQIESGSLSGGGGAGEQTIKIANAATKGASQVVQTNTETIIVYDNEEYDRGSNYDDGTGVFTIPSGGDGIYSICGSASVNLNPNGDLTIRIYKNTTLIKSFKISDAPIGISDVGVNCTGQFVANDEITIRILQITGQVATIQAGSNTRMSVTKLGV